MIREVLSRYPYGLWSSLAMLLFLALFLGALAWVFRKGSSEVYARLGRLPLDEKENRL